MIQYEIIHHDPRYSHQYDLPCEKDIQTQKDLVAHQTDNWKHFQIYIILRRVTYE